MLIFFFGPGNQTGNTIIFLRGRQSSTPLSPNSAPRGYGDLGASGRLPSPPETYGLKFPKTSGPLSRRQSLYPTPSPTHCFSCASRSLTSASRLFTRATSSSSRSCSRRFWASVFCQSVDRRLVIHSHNLCTPRPPLPAFSSFLVFLLKPYYRTTS